VTTIVLPTKLNVLDDEDEDVISINQSVSSPSEVHRARIASHRSPLVQRNQLVCVLYRSRHTQTREMGEDRDGGDGDGDDTRTPSETEALELAQLEALRTALRDRLEEHGLAPPGGRGRNDDADDDDDDDAQYARDFGTLRAEGVDDYDDDENGLSHVGASMRAALRMCDDDEDIIAAASAATRPSGGGEAKAEAAKAFEDIIAAAKSAGEDLNAKNADGETALHLAALYGKSDFAKTLVDAGADVFALDENAGTPAHDACASGRIDVVRAIFGAADALGRTRELLDARDEDGETPLHLAARGEHADVVRFLLSRGADARAQSASGETPERACEDEEVRKLLRGGDTAT
jgi:hypothetical protein